MEKTNFVHLHIYKLSEKLADEIWKVVARWNFFAKNTVGIQIVKGGRQCWRQHSRRERSRHRPGTKKVFESVARLAV